MLSGNFAEMTTSTQFRDLFHAANLRHGTDGFSSPPKEGVLRIFSPLKIRRLRPGLNPRTWVLKASTLPLDHIYCKKNRILINTYELTRHLPSNYVSSVIVVAPNVHTHINLHHLLECLFTRYIAQRKYFTCVS